MSSFYCKHCRDLYNLELSITNEIINTLYNEIVNEITLYNKEHVKCFIKSIDKYKSLFTYYNNKDILIYMFDMSCNKFTFDERRYILNNNKIISDSFDIYTELQKYCECGYGNSCGSGCIGPK